MRLCTFSFMRAILAFFIGCTLLVAAFHVVFRYNSPSTQTNDIESDNLAQTIEQPSPRALTDVPKQTEQFFNNEWLDSNLGELENKIRRNPLDYSGVYNLSGAYLSEYSEGHSVRRVLHSPNGRYVAFEGFDVDSVASIIVADLDTSEELVVFPPQEITTSEERRSVRGFSWSADNTLYVAEDAIDREFEKRYPAGAVKFNTLHEMNEFRARMTSASNVGLYEWIPVEQKSSFIGLTNGNFISMDSNLRGGFYAIVRDHEGLKVDEYLNGTLMDSRAIKMAQRGETLDYHSMKLTGSTNQLWFLSRARVDRDDFDLSSAKGRADYKRSILQYSLTTLDLEKPGAEPQTVIQGVDGFDVDPSAQSVVFTRHRQVGRWRNDKDYFVARNGRLDEPRQLESVEDIRNRIGPKFAGFSQDASVLYLLGHAQGRADLKPGSRPQLFEYHLAAEQR